MTFTITPSRAFFLPGESATLRICGGQAGSASVEITHLDSVVASLEVDDVQDGVEVSWTPPAQPRRGYGVRALCGESIARTAFDVLEHWTQAPRYGFLSEFGVQADTDPVGPLLRFHVNALQFYDWMWRHETLMPSEDPHTDLLGKQSSMSTVRRFIDLAHQYGVAAMPYAAVYAASNEAVALNGDWILADESGESIPFGDDYLTIVDPDPDRPFGRHLLIELERVLEETRFDGVHLDQYGHPKLGYDSRGSAYSLASPIGRLVDAVTELVGQTRESGAVVFNCVNNWPVETATSTRQDITYIEVWEPHTSYRDVRRIITDAQRLAPDKPVVLAAYIDPAYEHSVEVFDAVCFANGAGHIELGEGDALLADPYFPKFERMSGNLADRIAALYDFGVRYQELIGPASVNWESTPVAVTGPNTDSVHVYQRLSPGRIAISLVDLPDGKWNDRHSPGPGIESAKVTVGLDRPVDRVWAASPDDPEMVEVPFSVEGSGLHIEVPGWRLWQLIVIETGA